MHPSIRYEMIYWLYDTQVNFNVPFTRVKGVVGSDHNMKYDLTFQYSVLYSLIT